MTDGSAALTTPRLRLVPATIAMITAELEGADQLARVIDVNVARDWPPEHHDIDTLAFWREALRQQASSP